MPSAVRLGDTCTGHIPCPPRSNVSASSNVFINDKGAHRLGDVWAIHCLHDGKLASGSPNVFVNSKPQGRVGDSVSCGSSCAVGSSNVYVNG